MTIKKHQFVKAALCVASLALVACGDDGGGQAGDPDASTSFDADVSYVCDPMGANPAVGALLNAALESDVEVIVKTPQHPGDPGPTNLP